MDESDSQLLFRYSREKCEDSFNQLVCRHIDQVYSTALRLVGSPAIAEEVTQAVFVDLARKVSRVPKDVVLSAWLYQVARNKAIDVIRSESRRKCREQAAVEMSEHHESSEGWDEISPLLDEGMASLEESDRVVILMRFFDRKKVRDIGAALGLTEGAAQKRVSRALDRLRAHLTGQGLTLGSDALAGLIASRAVIAAPVGLACSVSNAAALVVGSASLGTIQTIAMTTIQKTIIATSLTLVIGTAIYQHQRAESLKRELLALRQETSVSMGALEMERNEALNDLGLMRDENESLRQDTKDLAKLRGEVARLRRSTAAGSQMAAVPSGDEAAIRNLVDRVSALKNQFDFTPAAWIPELSLVTESDWISAASGNISTEMGLRRAMSRIRGRGEGRVVQLLSTALKDFMDANEQRFPESVLDLEPFVEEEIDPSIYDRWEIADSDAVSNVKMGSDLIITQKEPIDASFDQLYVIGPGGHGSTDFLSSRLGGVLDELALLYQRAHEGRNPADPAALLPYVRTDAEREMLEIWLQRQEQHE